MLHFVLHKGSTPKINNVLKYNKLQRFRTTSKIYISFYRPYFCLNPYMDFYLSWH